MADKCARCLFSEECNMNPNDCQVITPIEDDFEPEYVY